MSDEGSKKLSQAVDDPLSANRDPNKKEWVKFEEENDETAAVATPKESTSSKSISNAPAVLDTSSIHVTIETAPKKSDGHQNGNDVSRAGNSSAGKPVMRTVELSERIQEGFVNGEVIVTLLPVNNNLPWVTPATFKPHLVPEELMAEGLTLTVEEYVHAMEMLVNDYRFTLYNICYKRVLMCWITLAFFVLLGLLFSGITGILLFSLGVSWLFLNAVAIFLCMYVKSVLARGLEKCLARVNKMLMKHKIIIALDDRGNISCHKINLCFIYFDPAQCIHFINGFLERSEHNGQPVDEGWESRLDIEANNVVITGSSNSGVSRKQNMNRGEQVVLRYAARWGKEMLRGYLKVSPNEAARHMVKSVCPCQFVENHLKCKPRGGYCLCCPAYSDSNHLYLY